MVPSNGAHHARERRTRLLVATLLATAVGCSEPTEPATPLTPGPVSLAAGGNQRVKVKTFQLSANTLRIDGPAVSGDASIGNSGPAIPSGVSIQGLIQQGAVTRQAALEPIVCAGSPGDVGKLPTGNCDVAFSAQASNSGVGNGILAPGSATFVLRVIQTIDGVETELASKSVLVNLVGSPTLGTPGVVSFAWAIDGPATSYTITLKNPASSMQGVFLRSTVVQGGARRSAGADVQASCGGGAGVFPPGVCTMTVTAAASTTAAGVGPLVPGPALIEVQLNQTVGGTITTFDTESAAIELVSSTPRIANVTLESTTLLIGGESVSYTAELQNAGFPVPANVILQGEMEQVQAGGTVLKGAGGTYVNCGSGLGALPTGTCNVQFSATALGDAIGGAFVSGPARFILHLYNAPPDQTPVEYDQRVIDVTLVAQAPSIVSITPASNYVVLDQIGAQNNITVNITNPGAPLSTVVVQGYIRQGTARRAAGGTNVTCGPVSGTLPSGACVQPHVISAFNANSGTGTLEPGNATFELELVYFDGTTNTTLDTKSIPITLVANIPSIVSISLGSTSLVINGPRVDFTATLYNPSGSALTGIFVQGWIDQISTLSTKPAGGVVLSCTGTNGEMPTGACVVSFTVGADNTGGTGTLVPGEATFRLELRQSSGVMFTKVVPITLVNP